MNAFITPSRVFLLKSRKQNNIKSFTEDNNETDNHMGVYDDDICEKKFDYTF